MARIFAGEARFGLRWRQPPLFQTAALRCSNPSEWVTDEAVAGATAVHSASREIGRDRLFVMSALEDV